MPPAFRSVCRCPFRRLAFPLLLSTAAVSLPAEEPQPVVLPEQVTSVHEPIIDGPFDRTRFMPPSAAHVYFNLPLPPPTPLLFLPPDPPPLDTLIPLRSPLDTGVTPPSELIFYVYDLFYPQLAARLAEDELPRRLRLRLDTYRELKLVLQEELHAALVAARQTDGEARLSLLAACAQRQAGRLQELEASAEQLRAELGRSRNEWHPGPPLPPPPGPGHAPQATAGRGPDLPFLRAMAYYADGLSADQRRLLLSIAGEGGIHPERGISGTPFFFTPEGASLRIPTGIPAALAERIAAYAEARRAIGRELVAALNKADRAETRDLRELAARQGPAFAALEQLAEPLRQTLHATPGIDGLPPAPQLPAELAARLTAYRDRRQALLRQLNATLTQTVRDAATATSAGLSVPVSAFTEEQQAEISWLNREKGGLRLALAEYHRANGSAQDRKSIDNLLEDFDRARQAQELREKYRDYRIALLEPGLSPAQRRLLFDAALQALAMPLPSGEPLHRP